jgi:hypothetical protein
VSEGFGVLPNEWEDGVYPEFEALAVGRGRRKEICMTLPSEVWLPQARLWAQGLEVMVHILMSEEE